MTDLLDLVPQAAAPPNAVAGYITAVDGVDVYAILPTFDITHRYGPLHGAPVSAGIGDACLVVFDEAGEPWYVAPALGGGGGDVDVNATAHAATLAPGAPATVAVTEPSANLFDFAFGIPAGVAGANGAPGAPGAAGAQGPAGATGPPGPAGPESYLHVYRTADQAIATGNQATIIFNASSLAQGPLPPTLNTSTGAITIPETGEWAVSFLGWWADNATGRRYMTIYSNVNGTLARVSLIPGGNNPGSTPTIVRRFTAGELVYAQVFQDSGGNLNFSNAVLDITKVTGAQGPAGPPGGNATATLDPWHVIGAAGEPIFANNWTNYGSGFASAAFRKDPFGRVHLRGLVKGGALLGTIFTLPAGYRPAGTTQSMVDAGAGGGQYAELRVDSLGNVFAQQGAALGYLSLDGLSFDTDTVSSYMVGPQGPKGDTGGNATVPIEAWKTVGNDGGLTVFGNNWTAYSPTYAPQYRKRPDGVVELRGLLKSGNTGQSAFVLPVGYRPGSTAEQYYPVVNFNNTAYIDGVVYITPSGATPGAVTPVTPVVAGGGAFLSLDGIRFSTTDSAFPTGPTGPQGPAGKNVISRGVDSGAIRQAVVGSYGEVNSALRIAVNFTLGNFVRFTVTGQWEHSAAGAQYFALHIYDVTAGAILPANCTYFVARSFNASQNVTYVADFVVPVATSGVAGFVQPGARTLTVYASTGVANCNLRNDTSPMVFTAQELQQ